MKIIALSDSHQDIDYMISTLNNERPDVLIHLGDHISDALSLKRSFPEMDFHCVAGNCDYGADHSLEQFITIGGKQFFIAHGHTYRVKRGLSLIKEKGLALGADITLFGHTHRSVLDCYNGMYLVNPGHIGRYTYDTSPASYATIIIENGEIRCDISL